MDWYKNINALGQIGWNQTALLSIPKPLEVQLHEAVLGMLAAIATGDEIAMVEARL
ncbi:hypothetical protein FB004_13212 [Sinorhizobium medicae]|uniref:Uncharacterized protein n=1 Tax=Sinorhizobium medicae TaxID=110321 RepID=A0A508WS63_9HYPH|nr:hypothetical protein FB006_1691 [Sinorhizobium medicae]TWA13309.1 hypothetical protein FB004_13212 [Sinorhizobium medicae]TWA22989.1 hypothetical protein FB007_1519 [Sinorhizobium medicae]TWA31062.1 hypothetical protein FB009_1415 [Sinorhizobium medicae]TWA32333.1 hypothetical protein FB005_1683 [Sinorhizobium medicae]